MSGLFYRIACWRLERAKRRQQRAFRALTAAQREVQASSNHYDHMDAIHTAVLRNTPRRTA